MELISAACGLAALAAYVITLSPTVAGGDSGELITAAQVMGIAHPPGYPLYTLLGKLFSLMPLRTVAWRVNLLSAVCDAAAAAFLCRATSRWTGNLWSGVLAAGLFAFSPIVWPYAVTAEVFALNNLFAAGLLDLSAAPQPPLMLSALWLGLGLTNHQTLLFLGLPFAAYALVRGRPQSLSRPALLRMGAAFVLGLSLYLYLPLAAAADPPLRWGDPTSVAGFFTHLLRREYGTFRLASQEVGAGGQLLPRLLMFWQRYSSTTWLLGPLLLVAAGGALARGAPARRLVLLWAGALLFYLVVFGSLANVRLDDPLHVTVQERFWQQALVVACALAGVGLDQITRRLGRASRATSASVALLLSAGLVAVNARAMDHSARPFFRDYGAAILESLPPDSLLLITSDEAVGSVRYLQQVEGLRTDVRVIPTGQVGHAWFRGFAQRHLRGVTLPTGDGFTARAFMDANIGRFPIFLVNKVPWLQTLEQAYKPWPVGLADQVLPNGQQPDLSAWAREASSNFARFDPSRSAATLPGSWERYTADNYWKQYRRFGMYLATAAASRGNEAAVHRAVVSALEPLAARDPAPEPSLFKNLGVAYQFLSRTDPAATERMVFHWRRYLALNPEDRDREAIRTLVEQAEAKR